MTYQEAVQYLNSLINYEKKDRYDYNKSFDLGRMRRLAHILGDPQKDIKSIHIAGTKGKGSTSAITHSILKSAGYRTGLYTSPHLVSFRERIKINDSMISEEDVARLLGVVRAAVDNMKDEPPSFFEVYTAIAYLYFKETRADFVVYEVGLGGRLDATNLLEPLVCAITPISYDHTDLLGATLARIAAEKGGIIKEGGICVSVGQEEEALGVIKNICKIKDAKLILVGKDISFEELSADDTGTRFSVKGSFDEYRNLETGLLGPHQVVNAATAIGIIESLRYCGIVVSGDAIRNGIKLVKWPGRLEVVSRGPLMVLDGAQNKASAHALVEAVKKIFKYKKLILVLGISKDKDIRGILDELLPIADSVILTKSNVVGRAAEPSRIKELMAISAKDAAMTQTVSEAVEKAASMAASEDLILITGSLFVVGEAKACVEKI